MRSNAITTATEKGRRSYQEDRLLVLSHSNEKRSGTLLAVMDGHNGSGVAEFCKDNIPGYFTLGKFERKECILTALERLVKHLNAETRAMESGSTLSLVFVPQNAERAYVAILGDSPIMIFDRDGNINISPEHNVRTNLDERAAAERRGGIYESGYLYNRRYASLGLQMGRALGDSWMGDVLNRGPETYSVPLGPKSVVVVATDGLVDPAHKDKEILDKTAARIKEGPTAEELLQWAQDQRKGMFSDNATVIVWKGQGWGE